MKNFDHSKLGPGVIGYVFEKRQRYVDKSSGRISFGVDSGGQGPIGTKNSQASPDIHLLRPLKGIVGVQLSEVKTIRLEMVRSRKSGIIKRDPQMGQKVL